MKDYFFYVIINSAVCIYSILYKRILLNDIDPNSHYSFVYFLSEKSEQTSFFALIGFLYTKKKEQQ
jgi:hypothetical protein